MIREISDNDVQEMLDLGVIEPYSSGVVLVPKNDNSVRFYVEFWKINKITESDAKPIPNTEEILANMAKMAENKYLSKFDLCKCHWQLLLSDQAKYVTDTPIGTHIVAMPFGYVNSEVSFFRLIRKLLNGLDSVDSFVYGMWVSTKAWDLLLC